MQRVQDTRASKRTTVMLLAGVLTLGAAVAAWQSGAVLGGGAGIADTAELQADTDPLAPLPQGEVLLPTPKPTLRPTPRPTPKPTMKPTPEQLDGQSVTYEIKIRTDPRKDWGTGTGMNFCTEQECFKLDTKKDDFEEGHTDTFKVKTRYDRDEGRGVLFVAAPARPWPVSERVCFRVVFVLTASCARAAAMLGAETSCR